MIVFFLKLNPAFALLCHRKNTGGKNQCYVKSRSKKRKLIKEEKSEIEP